MPLSFNCNPWSKWTENPGSWSVVPCIGCGRLITTLSPGESGSSSFQHGLQSLWVFSTRGHVPRTYQRDQHWVVSTRHWGRIWNSGDYLLASDHLDDEKRDSTGMGMGWESPIGKWFSAACLPKVVSSEWRQAVLGYVASDWAMVLASSIWPNTLPTHSSRSRCYSGPLYSWAVCVWSTNSWEGTFQAGKLKPLPSST